ncbi:14007_t:CDS:2, partial [Funneliformis geosporum]
FAEKYKKLFSEVTSKKVRKAFKASQISGEFSSTGMRKSTELDKLLYCQFENIVNIVKSQRAKLSEMQRDQQNNSIIKHNEDLPVIEKKLLYVRKSYKYLYEQLKKKSDCSLYRLLITGKSGVRKSYFLIYVLMQLLCEGTLEEILFCQKYVFPLVPEETVINLFNKAGEVPRYVLQYIELSIKDFQNNIEKEEGLDA